MSERDAYPEENNDMFEFDAPQIKDFTKKEYQTQKKRIEMLLEIHGNPGVPQDPSKEAKKKTIKKVPAAAPRKTFFSEIFKGEAVHAKENKKVEGSVPPEQPENPFDQSVDDEWFRKKEEEILQFQDMSVRGILRPDSEAANLLTRDLFGSDDEKDILPQLRVIATPPIKKTKQEMHSAEFNKEDIEELSRSFKSSLYK
ncbi:hypothetical protein NEAUS03_1746 [Nematocida ausubeli]|nr:hypothetical protein NEAUS03_1746 [Nematocida ausubeli]